jgi:hypothetical protein
MVRGALPRPSSKSRNLRIGDDFGGIHTFGYKP